MLSLARPESRASTPPSHLVGKGGEGNQLFSPGDWACRSPGAKRVDQMLFPYGEIHAGHKTRLPLLI